MFESFYGLTTNPFRMSADEQFRYAHRAYVKAWSYIKYALEQGEGFVLITGRPGTGKTTLVRDTLSELDNDRIYAVNLVSNQLQGEELLRLVALEFGYQAQEFNKATLLTRIEQHALSLHEQGRRVVVIVDEAQNLSGNGLEELRLLSNLQIGNQPLFQIVLVGQEELRSLIYGREMENITQRIVASCRLEPMQAQQVQGYVEHRLSLTGWDKDPKFDTDIFELLHRIAHGVPREINLVMARLLLYGALEKKHHLNSQDLLIVLKELVEERRLTFDQTLLVEELHNTAAAEGSVEETKAEDADGNVPESHEAATTAVSADSMEDEREDRQQEAAEEVDEIRVPEQEAPAAEIPDTSAVETEEFVPMWNDRDETAPTSQQIEDEALLTGDEAFLGELPPMPVLPDEEERRPQGLLTDVDELLGEEHASREGVGKLWRWFFYPMAIAALLIALLIPNTNDLTVLWRDVVQWAGGFFGSAPVTERHGEQDSQLPPRGKASDGPPADGAAIPGADNPDRQERARGSRSSSSAVQGSAGNARESDGSVAAVLKGSDQDLWLVIDKTSGEPTRESQASYTELVQILKADTSLIVVLTGISESGLDPIAQLRDALEQAERASKLLVRDGITRQRIVVEGKAAGESERTKAVHVRLKPMVGVGIDN